MVAHLLPSPLVTSVSVYFFGAIRAAFGMGELLNELAGKLDPDGFVRVHRSAIVNIESILQLEPISHGEFEVVLKNGSRPRISRPYRTQLEKRLGQSL